ncbi:MAG: RpiB/LacA/LacB family sugar-phosphate isomerase [Verrucomicrobiota bacterium]
MKIAIAADHGGYEFKGKLTEFLKEQGHEVMDCGPHTLDPADDYPDFGKPAATAVSEGKADRAILTCNNGIGMSILANKMKNVRAAVVYNEKSAANTREHHDSNVLALGGQEFSEEDLLRFTDIWLKTEFQGGRHERRMSKIMNASD